MSKYCGQIGFAVNLETKPGVYESRIITEHVRGDIIRDTRRYGSTEKVNDDITLTNQISILANPKITEHLGEIKYITFLNSKWKISSFEVKHPRIILTLGGLYNE